MMWSFRDGYTERDSGNGPKPEDVRTVPWVAHLLLDTWSR